MKINKIGRQVTCPASGWLKCRNPACGLTWYEEFRETPERKKK